MEELVLLREARERARRSRVRKNFVVVRARHKARTDKRWLPTRLEALEIIKGTPTSKVWRPPA